MDQDQRADARACVMCGSDMRQRMDEHPSEFKRRATCGRECRYALIASKRRSTRNEKRCAVCGAVFARREGEPAGKFTMRQTCGKTCRYALVSRRATLDIGEKHCTWCGKRFGREGRSAAHFVAIQYCGRECFAASRRGVCAAIAGKTCAVCGTSFGRRPDEQAGNYRRRSTCSAACARRLGQRRRDTGVKENAAGYPSNWRRINAVVRSRDNHLCRLCGATRGRFDLAVHHINYDKRDCRRENLISLCIACHGKTNHGDRAEWTMRFRAMLDHEDGAAAP